MKYEKLRKLNIWMGAAHGAQALVLIVISSDFSREITSSYLVYDENVDGLVTSTRVLFDFPFVWGVAAFSLLSMVFHFLIATVFYKNYLLGLKKGMNKYRWYEYSLSASLMIVLIAILTGIFDAGTLLLMFGVTGIMNLLGLVMEVHNQTTTKTNWLSYNIGVIAGVLPWLVIMLAFWASATAPENAQGPPTFVYFIWGSIFLFFNAFAVNMFLQYKKLGKWSDYLHGERVYLWLSLLAKGALIWQIFAGTLQP